MILIVDEEKYRSNTLARGIKDNVRAFSSGDMFDYLNNSAFPQNERLILCVNANYHDYIDPNTSDKSSYPLRHVIARVREIRPLTHIMVYAGLPWPTEKILLRLRPDSYMDDDMRGFIDSFIQCVQKLSDTPLESAKERGLSTIILPEGQRMSLSTIIEKETGRCGYQRPGAKEALV
jgi:hypothetical protein